VVNPFELNACLILQEVQRTDRINYPQIITEKI
jgi:hypothetical protein